MEAFEAQGKWWVPSDPKRCPEGKLTFDRRNGAILVLSGDIIDTSGFSAQELMTGSLDDIDIIHGRDLTGRKYTLQNSMASGSHRNLQFPDQTEVRLSPKYVFRNIHFNPAEPITFDEMSVSFSGLKTWYGNSGIETQFRPEPTEGEPMLTSTYTQPEISIARAGDIELRFVETFSVKDMSDSHGVHWEQDMEVAIVPPNPLTLDEFLNGSCYHFLNFLSLGTGQLEALTKIYGSNIKDEAAGKGAVEQTDKERVDIFYHLSANDAPPPEIHPVEMIFRFPQIKKDFGEYLAALTEKDHLLKAVYDLFFANFGKAELFKTTIFVNIMQALEVFHRQVRPIELSAERDHNDKVERILSTCPEEDTDWLKGVLTHSGGPALHKRLKSLIAEQENLLILTSKQKKKLIRRCSDSRNYYTHFDKSLEEKALEGVPLYFLTEFLKWIVIFALLKEIGFREEHLKRISQTNHAFLRARRKYLAIT